MAVEAFVGFEGVANAPMIGLFIIGSVCADPGGPTFEYPEMEALSRLDLGAAVMKVFLARRLTSEFKLVTADVEEKSVIIGERDRAAMDEFRRAINDRHRRIAILYWGGHMPDFGPTKMAELSDWALNRYQTLALLSFSSVLAIDMWFWELFFGTAVSWVSQLAPQVAFYL